MARPRPSAAVERAAGGEAEQATDAGHAPGERSPWQTALTVASQTAILVAVLFYFGWASAGETFRYFGVDLSLLGFDTTDYLLRSIYSAYQPLLVVGIAALIGTLVHQLLVAGRARRGHRWRARTRAVPLVVLGVGAIAAGGAALALILHPITRILGRELPAVLAVGAILCVYADYSWPVFRGSGGGREAQQARRVRAFLLSALALLGAFWWIALYAVETGHDRALSMAAGLRSAHEVALYSSEPLAISAPGLDQQKFSKELRYRYRYTGLRLLIHADDQYFLLPRGWVHGRDSVVVVPEGDDVRLEMIAGA